MNRAVLDSDTLSEVHKQLDRVVERHARQYRRAHGRFTFSAFSRYEVERDLRLTGRSAARLADFRQLCDLSDVIAIRDEVMDRAALWVVATEGGHPRDDGDLIIAATALLERMDLVTGNTAHFDWIPGLTLVNWRLP